MVPKRSFQIAINSIPETGRDISLDLGLEWFARWREEDPDLGFSGAQVMGKVHLGKYGRDILVRGHLDGKLDLNCSRCLESFVATLQSDFDLLLVPGPEKVSEEGEELAAPDLDLDFYSGEVVDLEGILKEQIILMLPLKPLCAETCRGLCPLCGANLEREGCRCKAEKSDSPLAALAKLKV
ncbi:MAG: DUF177 domain-containing protein [Desulfobaccales bacterium]|nr:DUF177 domain-containing protein [Desulfobaccales bacterium]